MNVIIGNLNSNKFANLDIDVIKSITRKFENIQKGMGDIMRGALIETQARTILNQGINQNKRETALRMLKRGKLTINEIAEDSGLSVAEVEQLKKQIPELLSV